MYNQFLLTELIRAQVRAEHDALTEQDTVRMELQEQGINIDDLVITGEVSLHNVFHSSATYQRIEREIFREQHYPDESLQLFTLYVEVMLNTSPFKAYLGHKDMLFPFMHEPTKHSLAILEKVETYLLQRQASRMEIK